MVVRDTGIEPAIADDLSRSESAPARAAVSTPTTPSFDHHKVANKHHDVAHTASPPGRGVTLRWRERSDP
jgi:hypothetical protein